MILYALSLAIFSSKLENEKTSIIQENEKKNIYMIVYFNIMYLKGFGSFTLLINMKLKELRDSRKKKK